MRSSNDDQVVAPRCDYYDELMNSLNDLTLSPSVLMGEIHTYPGLPNTYSQLDSVQKTNTV